jgi:ribonuclease P protein subunit POP4
MITLENLKFHEMIGMQAKIIKSTNPQINNIKGSIVNETKSTFILSTNKGLKKFPKQQNVWEFQLNGAKISLNGKMISKKPEDRIGMKK